MGEAVATYHVFLRSHRVEPGPDLGEIVQPFPLLIGEIQRLVTPVTVVQIGRHKELCVLPCIWGGLTPFYLDCNNPFEFFSPL